MSQFAEITLTAQGTQSLYAAILPMPRTSEATAAGGWDALTADWSTYTEDWATYI